MIEQIRHNSESPEIQRMRKQWKAILDRVGTKDEDEMERLGDIIGHFAAKLRDIYGEKCNAVAAYHILAGSSTIASIEIEDEDFPGEDSVATFMDTFEKEV